VPASQRQTCEEIFELYLLMMAPFFGRTAVDEKYPHNSHPEPFSRTQLRNCPNHISHMLLDFLFRHYDWNPLLRSLMLLAAALLSVSLAHANYSTSLIAVLKLFDAGNVSAGKVGADMRSLAPSITGYLNVRIVRKHRRRNFYQLCPIIVTCSGSATRLQQGLSGRFGN
jgi:hypothetical protein